MFATNTIPLDNRVPAKRIAEGAKTAANATELPLEAIKPPNVRADPEEQVDHADHIILGED